jgi:hypothetical protein
MNGKCIPKLISSFDKRHSVHDDYRNGVNVVDIG